MPTQLATRHRSSTTYHATVRAIEAELVRLRQRREAGVWCQGLPGRVRLEFFCGEGCLSVAATEALAVLKGLPAPASLEQGEALVWGALWGLTSTVVVGQRLEMGARGRRARARLGGEEEED